MASPFLMKAASGAAKDPGETGKKIGKIVIGILTALILIFCMMLELLSSFNGNVLNEEFDPYSIEIYQEATKVRADYLQKLKDEMQEEEQRIIEENTYTVDNEDGTTSEKCDITVEKTVNEINISYALAYVNYKEESIHRWDGIIFNKNDLLDFFENISTMKVSERIDDVYYIYNEILSAEEVADIYFSDDEKIHQMYIASFDLYVSFLDNRGIITDESWKYVDGELQTDPITHDSGIDIPHYFQNDFLSTRYGNGTIASSGCAPTSLAMVISGLTGKKVSPVDVVNWTGNRYYASGQGSTWSIFPACAKQWGISCSNLGKSQNNVIAALQAGKPVIASMGKGTFTKGGHLIVIRGVTTDGYFLVNDPNKKNYKKYGTDRFKTSVVFSEAKNFWCFK